MLWCCNPYSIPTKIFFLSNVLPKRKYIFSTDNVFLLLGYVTTVNKWLHAELPHP